MDNTYKPDSILELEKKYGITLENRTGLKVDYTHKKYFQLNESGEVIVLRIREAGIKEIKKMDLFPSLMTLDLSSNYIIKLEGLDKLTKLKELYLENNQILEIEGLNKLSDLRTLSLENNQISELKGLNKLINLQTLSFSNNQISELKGLDKLINLKILSFSDNQISELKGLDKLIELEKMFLSNNRLVKLKGLSELTNLQELYLHNNMINVLDEIDQLTNLKILSLENNQISRLKGLDKLINLKTLSLGNNKISRLEGLDKLINLKTLSLGNNEISKLESLDKLTSLRDLILNNNLIDKLEGLDNLVDLKTLSLEGNQISKLEGLDKLISLKELILNNNLIGKLEGLDEILQLERLFLSSNKINKLEGLERLPKLNRLFLNNNQIKKLEGLERLTKLNCLSLENNQISKLESLGRLSSLERLYLGKNKIGKLEGLRKLTNLKELSLNNNLIKELEGLDKLPFLKFLFLDNNYITQIKSLENLEELTELSLRNNQIEKIEGLDKLKSLFVLQLSGNQIVKIQGFDKLLSLRVLFLSNNKIEAITSLKKLSNLLHLDISNNQIIEIDSLEKLNSLQTLDISNNRINKIPKSLKEVLSRLLTLHIDGNKFLQDQEIILDPYGNHRDDILNLIAEEGEEKEEFKYPYKVMLLGNHGAGKSTFLHHYDNKYELNGSTHILQIFKSEKKDFPKINFYDFGGQDYYHGIYQVFFTNKTLNMLFWCNKTDQNRKSKDRTNINILNFNKEYWLSQIRYAYDRKRNRNLQSEKNTLVVQTYKDDPEFEQQVIIEKEGPIKQTDINDSKKSIVKKTCSLVIEHFFISLATTEEIGEKKRQGYDHALHYLEFRLKSEIEERNEKKYPKSQIELYKEIQKLQGSSGYNYTKIEDIPNVYERSLLKAKLYQLYRRGEILYYREDEKLENVVWLNPAETVKQIHSILSEDRIKEKKGRVPKADMENAFEKDPLLLRLLEIEKVIFHDQKKGVYIIPGYLSLAEEDEAYSWLTIGFLAPNFTLKFENFIPFGLINQLICYYGSGENELKRYWRDQLIFTLRGEYMVWIALDFEKLKIEVYINSLPKGDRTKISEIEEEIFLDLFCFYWDKRPLQKGIEFENSLFLQRKQQSENKTQRILEIRNRVRQELKLERQKKPIPDLYISCYDPKLKPEEQLYVKLQKLDDPEQTKSTITGYPLTQEGEVDREKEQRVSTKRYKHFSINPALKSVKRVFISYSKSDIADLEELNKFLTDMIREEKIEVYYDKTTTPGDMIHEVIKEQIIEADYVIALVSQNYISTDYIRDIEHPLIKEHNKPLIPIIIKPCTWTLNDISKHYAVLKGAEISFPDWNKNSNSDNYDACRSENWRKVIKELNEKIFTNKDN